MIKDFLDSKKIKYKENERLAQHTYYQIGGDADYFVLPKNSSEVEALIHFLIEKEIKYYVLGWGANVLFSDDGFRGVVISSQNLNNITLTKPDLIIAESGSLLQDVIDFGIKKSLGGISELSGIPGTIGGNIKMNAGAFGKEIADVFEETTLINQEGIKARLKKADLGFKYRRSNIKNGAFVLEATLKLYKCDPKQEIATKQEIIQKRALKQPIEFPSCGSVFKKAKLMPNEPKNTKIKIDWEDYKKFNGIPAGVLIEAVGLKGTQIGQAQISPKHANFFVNLGGAKANDILELINLVIKEVFTKTGYILEPEVQLIGLKQIRI